MINRSGSTKIFNAGSSPHYGKQVLATCGNFLYTKQAAPIIEQHPETVMHLALNGLPRQPVIIKQGNGHELLRQAKLGSFPVFYTAAESDGQEQETTVIPAYPNVVSAFEIMRHQVTTEMELCQDRANLALRLESEYKRPMSIYQPSPEGYRNPLIISFGDFDITYRGVSLLKLYNAFFQLSQKRPKIKQGNFLDLGSGLGYVCLLASLFFNRVSGIEYLETLQQLSLSIRDELAKSLPHNHIDIEKGDYHERDMSQTDYVFFWQVSARTFLPQLLTLKRGAHVLGWEKFWSDREMMFGGPEFRFCSIFGTGLDSFYLFRRN